MRGHGGSAEAWPGWVQEDGAVRVASRAGLGTDGADRDTRVVPGRYPLPREGLQLGAWGLPGVRDSRRTWACERARLEIRYRDRRKGSLGTQLGGPSEGTSWDRGWGLMKRKESGSGPGSAETGGVGTESGAGGSHPWQALQPPRVRLPAGAMAPTLPAGGGGEVDAPAAVSQAWAAAARPGWRCGGSAGSGGGKASSPAPSPPAAPRAPRTEVGPLGRGAAGQTAARGTVEGRAVGAQARPPKSRL